MPDTPDFLKKVLAFHQAFQIPSHSAPQKALPDALCRLRFDLLEEENAEYLEACEAKDLVKIADALGDILYVLAGTIVTHGLQDVITDVFDEIHRSNMSKLDATGKPIFRADGKILKSDQYFRPDIRKVLLEKGVIL